MFTAKNKITRRTAQEEVFPRLALRIIACGKGQLETIGNVNLTLFSFSCFRFEFYFLVSLSFSLSFSCCCCYPKCSFCYGFFYIVFYYNSSDVFLQYQRDTTVTLSAVRYNSIDMCISMYAYVYMWYLHKCIVRFLDIFPCFSFSEFDNWMRLFFRYLCNSLRLESMSRWISLFKRVYTQNFRLLYVRNDGMAVEKLFIFCVNVTALTLW